MTAYVILSPEAGGSTATLEAIVRALYSKGVVWGMNESKIRELVKNPFIIYKYRLLKVFPLLMVKTVRLSICLT